MGAVYNFNYLDEINLNQFIPMKEKDCYSERPLTVEIVPQGIVLPYKPLDEPEKALGGVITDQGKYITISGQRIVGKEMNQGYSCLEYQKVDKRVVYFGAFHEHWGHFLTEMVCRCWYFLKHNIEKESLYVAYLRKWDTCNEGLRGNYLEFLELLGIPKDRLIEVNKPTQFLDVIIPELSCRAGFYYTKEYKNTFNALRDAVDDPYHGKTKSYFTRLQSKSLRSSQMGEKRIEKLFVHNGFQVIAAEHCTLREQILHIKNCKNMVTIEGTLPHNILFANDGIELTILKRTGETNFYQTLINQVRDAKVTYVDVNISLFPVFAGGPFLMNVSDQLVAYAKDRAMKLPKHRENSFRLHIQLIWYFFCYLDNMTSDCIEHWGLKEKYGEYVMGHYAFHRKRMKVYDKKLVSKFRKCFYLIARMFE